MTRTKNTRAMPRLSPSDTSSDDGVPIYTPPESVSPTTPTLEQEIDRIVNNVVNSISGLTIQPEKRPVPASPNTARGKTKAPKAKKDTPTKTKEVKVNKDTTKTKDEKAKPKKATPKVAKDSAQLEEKITVKKIKKTTVVNAWQDYFGNESQLANWQRLCADVGLEEVPRSITQCKKVCLSCPFLPLS